jgi:predicted transposase/invertase (TIGR01784 family)
LCYNIKKEEIELAKVAYQNNDIIMKYMSEAFKDTALDFYGLDTVRIKAVIPTELPVLDVSEENMDFVFLLEDQSLLHLEFQITERADNLARFLLYDARLYKKVRNTIQTAVIYSGEIKTADNRLETGSINYSVSNIFMNKMNGDKIYSELDDKISGRENLSDKDKLNLIFLPLMKSSINKNEMAIKAVELAKKVENDESRLLYIGAIVGISDKFIDKDYVARLKEVLKMTRVGMELKKEGISEGRIEGIKEGKIEDARKMIMKGFSREDIIEITGLQKEEIERLYELNKEKH